MDRSSSKGKPDDLEITSIGAIYNGPSWDKKYWSSSRGKDRYPYPVGYQAIRTHNGNICKMEIHEGHKGPLFLINSSDGRSCSGQTPDIAWDIFQKKGCSSIKMSHQKRSSCKIDGVEFFGFRNPFVQRLLRELLANVNGTVQQSSLSSSFCYGALGTANDAQCSDSCTYTDSLSYLERSRITRKRSRQHKTKNIKRDGGPKVKKLQSLDLMYNFRQGNEKSQNDKNSVTSFALDEKHESVGLEAAVDGKTSLSSSQCGLHLESFQFCDTVKEDTLIPQVDSAHISPRNFKSTKSDCKSLTNAETLDRAPPDTEASRFNSSKTTKDRGGKVSVPKDCPGITLVDLCVPDTLDPLQEADSAFASTCPRESPCNVENSLVPAEDLFARLHSEGLHSSISHPSSEMSDFDSVGHEIAKSMMTVLLPQALPLLKTSRKKKVTVKPSVISQYEENSEDANNKNNHFVDVTFTAVTPVENGAANRKEKLDLSSDPASVPLESKHIKAVIPDSFDSDKCLRTPDNLELLGSGDAQKKPSPCHLSNSVGKEIFGQVEHVDPNERPSKVEKHISESALGCSSPCIKVFARRSKNVSINCNGSSKCPKTYSEEKVLTSAPKCRAENVDNKMVDDQSHVDSNSRVRTIQKKETSFCDNETPDMKELQTASRLESHKIMEHNNELEGIVDLVGCYVHPMTVSSLVLHTKGNEIFICVLCGHLVGKERTLFLYKVPFKEQSAGYPSFIGHAPITLSTSKDNIGREIVMERSCLQFTPDGHLVAINKIKAPYCRKQKFDCSCPTCASDFYEENAVKILQVELGYVSVLANLKTADSVRCILVCGPHHLVAVEESGKLHIWVMNAIWSAQAEEFVIPTYDFIVEVKKIPKCNLLIVGHNGYGEFSLWDISKHALISRFSAPSTLVFDFFPVSLFSLERNCPASSGAVVVEHVNRIMDTTKKWFLDQSANCAHLPLEGEDVAVWLLVSTVSNSDVQHCHESYCETNLGGWRLALLVKNLVILGSQLDPRAATVGTSADHGIIGTHDGLVYMYEISTGTNLGTLHYFKGRAVSCIAVDDESWPHLMGIASEGGELLVYLHSQRDFANSDLRGNIALPTATTASTVCGY